MDPTMVLVLVLAVVFLGSILWLVVHSRKQSQKHPVKTSIKPPKSQHKDRVG